MLTDHDKAWMREQFIKIEPRKLLHGCNLPLVPTRVKALTTSQVIRLSRSFALLDFKDETLVDFFVFMAAEGHLQFDGEFVSQNKEPAN